MFLRVALFAEKRCVNMILKLVLEGFYDSATARKVAARGAGMGLVYLLLLI